MDQENPQEQQAPGEANENEIVDQIGALLSQLSPEKQKGLLDQLQQLVGGQMPNGAPEAGPNGVPVGP